jgi:hypothetical protein
LLYNASDMTLFGYGLFFFVVCVQTILFWRGHVLSLWRRYPLFFAYLSYTAVCNICQFFLNLVASPVYRKFYWASELVAAVVRFAVAWEVYRQILPQGTNVRRIAGAFLAIALTILAVLFYVSGTSFDSLIPDFMRKMAVSVAAWILLVLGIAQYYGIRIGRNIWGMAIGLLIFVATEIVNFSAFALTHRMPSMWAYVRPFTYVLMLLIWVSALWNYTPNPPILVPDEKTGSQALSAWRVRWTSVDSVLRKALKP